MPARMAMAKANIAKAGAGKSAAVDTSHSGHIKSKKAKVGGICSSAMSEWKLHGMTPSIAATLGKCRSQARAHGQADLHEAAGNTARAQVLRHRAETGKVGTANRAAQAKTLRAEHATRIAAKAHAAAKPAPKPAPTPQDRVAAARSAYHAKLTADVAKAKATPAHVAAPPVSHTPKPVTPYVAPPKPVTPPHVLHEQHSASITAKAKGLAEGGSGRVWISDLRAAHPQFSREQFDSAMKHAVTKGHLAAYGMDDPAQFGVRGGVKDAARAAADKAAAFRTPSGNERYVVYPTGRSSAAPAATSTPAPPPLGHPLGWNGIAGSGLPVRKPPVLVVTPPTTPPKFSLAPQSVHGVKATTFENAPGRTGTMFDMKRGDLPGQTSIFDKVGTVQASTVTPTPAHAPMSATERRALSRGIPPLSGGSPQAIMDRANAVSLSRSKKAAQLQGLRAKIAASKVDPSSHTEHAPGHVGNLQTSLIHTDPSRFQYKIHQTDSSTGSVGSLAGVKKYDPELGGVLQVWKDPANGKVFVVNGHNRLELANKLGADKVAVRFIDAPNAQQARAKGALTNIAEGRGNSTDAAKFFRDTGISKADLDARGVPLREKVASEGLALSGLSDPLFRKVAITGELSPERGAIIGGSGLSHDQQHALHSLIESHKGEVNNGTLKQLTDIVKSSGSTKSGTRSLFGDDDNSVNLAIHKARVQDQIARRLGSEKKLFGTVAKTRAAENLQRGGNTINTAESGRISKEAGDRLQLFDQMKNLRGPVSSHLNEAAERIHAGESEKKVVDETYRRLIKDFPTILNGSLPGHH